jgi:hypothetical protein
MTTVARRRTSTRVARAGQWLDRKGGALLVRGWSLVVAIAVWLLGLIERALVTGWRWFSRRSLVGKALVVALAVMVAYLAPRAELPSILPVYLDDDVEALARVVRSEAGIQSDQQRLHVAWATRNLAAERGQTVAEMACSPCGRQERGRPVSSRQAATDRDRALARLVVGAPAMLDPTGGATHFINPALQDKLARSGAVPGYRGNTYAVVRQRWMTRYGWAPYYRLGPDLEMWGPARPKRAAGKRR